MSEFNQKKIDVFSLSLDGFEGPIDLLLSLVDENTGSHYLSLRAEQLSVEDFMNLTSCFE